MTVFDILWTPQRAEFLEGGNTTKGLVTNSSFIPTATCPVRLDTRKGHDYDRRNETVDWLVVRNYVFPEPNHGLYFSEPTPAPFIVTSPSDITYAENAPNNVLRWNVTDTDPSFYLLYRDQSLIDNSSWFNGIWTTITVDGLTIGNYDFTIFFFDTMNHWISDQVWVTVEESQPPSIIFSPDDLTYEEGIRGLNLTWTATVASPSFYLVFRNHTEILNMTWQSAVPVTVSVENLTAGLYNFTIVFFEFNNKSSGSTCWVDVEEALPPELYWGPDSFTIEQNYTGYYLDWAASDISPSHYVVYRNDVSIQTGTWVSSYYSWDAVVISLDGLSVGLYNYTIVYFDLLGLSTSHTVWVTVEPNQPPTIWESPADLVYEEGYTGNELYWYVDDGDLSHCDVYRNGTYLFTMTYWWYWGIYIDVDGLAVGSYLYRIEVFDAVNNSVTDEAWVFVEPPNVPVIVKFPLNRTYVEGTIGFANLSWTAVDSDPSSVVIYHNGLILIDTPWFSNFAVELRLQDLSIGVHTYTIVFSDIIGNSASHTVWVTVLEATTSSSSSTPLPSSSDHSSDHSTSTSSPFIGIELVLIGLCFSMIFIRRRSS
jgi:hypothetical protein